MMIDSTAEAWIRLSAFMGILAVMMLWEWCKPNRQSAVNKSKRWTSNFCLVVLGALIARLIVPTGLATVAIWAQQHKIGLWNLLSVNLFWSVLVSVLLFDCLIYWQHRIFHRIPILWRLHKVHHADPHLDTSTGLRFHPLEIALSIMIKILAVLLLGAPLLAILIFEVLLNATSMFNHTNIKLPKRIENPLRKVMITQALHRIHHSQVVCETDSNFSFNLSIWDRLFGTYIKEAESGDDAIKLGLKEYPTPQANSSLKALLLMPFRRS